MDRAFFPYGKKSKEFLCKRMIYLCEILIRRQVDFILIGCNTASIETYDLLKDIFNIKIFSIFNLLLPYFNSKNVFIGTTNSCKYVTKKYNLPCIDGSELIEAIEYKREYTKILNNLFNRYCKYDKLILGCTHFLFIDKKLFNKEVIDQGELFLKQIKKIE